MAILLNDIALYLAANAVGTIGTNLFWGSLPDSPDSCVSLIQSTGSGSVHAPSVIRIVSTLVRGKDYTATGALANQIYSLFHNKLNMLTGVVGTTHAVGFSRMEQLPMHIGKDPQSRHVWSLTSQMNISVL